MQAIILAAGMGRRLKELTAERTKCMVPVNGVTLIERMLEQLDALSLERIVIVVGYCSDKLIAHIGTLPVKTPIIYVYNEIYDKTNNIYSLYLAREYLVSDNTLLFESDLIFEDSVLEYLLQNSEPNVALVAKYEGWMDGTVVKIGEDGEISDFIDKKRFRFSEIDSYYKTVNIYKFSKEFSQNCYVPFLEAYIKALGENEYYEQVLKVIALADKSAIKPLVLHDEGWFEIDDAHDLDIAETLFTADDKDKYSRICQKYGGYWRYPHLLDFCYIVNPYYPPQQLIDEMQANFKALLTDYPSGSSIVNLLVAKNFGIKREYIAVTNGAAEAIKVITSQLMGKVGIISPSFEEYRNRLSHCELVVYSAYRYSADDLIQYFEDKKIGTVILVNPDNPSGNFLDYNELQRMLEWCKRRNVKIVIDESFIDFADRTATLLNTAILEQYRNLTVIKSLGKNQGIPGLRLGIVASADTESMDHIRRELPIWNINALAEFYLQICGKYEADYSLALELFCAERERFAKRLAEIEDLNVMPSSANFFMAEVRNGMSARNLCEQLLKHNILCKDLSCKRGIDGEYIRIAIKTSAENDIFIGALKKVIQGIRYDNN